jgi:hypothetical protein
MNHFAFNQRGIPESEGRVVITFPDHSESAEAWIKPYRVPTGELTI